MMASRKDVRVWHCIIDNSCKHRDYLTTSLSFMKLLGNTIIDYSYAYYLPAVEDPTI